VHMHVLNACWSNKHDWRADWTAHGWSLLGLGWFSAAAMTGAARIQAAAAICHIVDSTRPPLPWTSESAEQETFSCEKLTLQAVPRAVCNAMQLVLHTDLQHCVWSVCFTCCYFGSVRSRSLSHNSRFMTSVITI